MQIKRIGLSLLVIVSSTPALAGFGMAAPSPREAVRAYHMQNIALERDNQRPQQPPQQQPEQRRGRENAFTDSSGSGGEAESHANSSADNARKQGRLSPEERRALRRQIDEAGHDIYVPRR